VLLLTILLYGCENYQVSLNEMPLYEPPGLLTDLAATDPALRDCLDQTIADSKVTQAGQLTSLFCSHAGIKSIAGVQQFTALVLVNLADNEITSLEGLTSLSKLSRIDLSNNALTELQPLLNLPKLKAVNLAGNKQLRCTDIELLKHKPGLVVQAPEHCA